MAFFTEREGEVPPQISSEVPAEFVEAVVSELIGLADRAWLARGWPAHCLDPGQEDAIVGTDRHKFWQATRSKLRLASTRVEELVNESPLAVLNVIEFVYQHVAYPVPIDTHKYYGHKHFDFDGPEGKSRYRDEINELFQRYGLAFELDADGQIIRLAPEEIRAQLMEAVFQTGDDQLDELLNTARTKFLSPQSTDRREGLEKLWDAVQRLRTVEDGRDTKARATALIEAAYNEPDARTRLNTELLELANIGNQYNIRHFETDRLPIPDDAFADYLFVRCYSATCLLLIKTGRVR